MRRIVREKKNRELSSYNTKVIIMNLTLCDFTTAFIQGGALLYSRGDLRNTSRAFCGVCAAILCITLGMTVHLVLFLGYVRYRCLTQKPYVDNTQDVNYCANVTFTRRSDVCQMLSQNRFLFGVQATFMTITSNY